MQKKNLFVKLKEDKGARAIAITVVVMLLVLTAIIITTVVANRTAVQDGGVLPPDDSTQAGIKSRMRKIPRRLLRTSRPGQMCCPSGFCYPSMG